IAQSDGFTDSTWSEAIRGGGRSGRCGFTRLCRGRGGWLSGGFDPAGRLLGGVRVSQDLIDGRRFDVRTHGSSPFRIFEIGPVPHLTLRVYTAKCAHHHAISSWPRKKPARTTGWLLLMTWRNQAT